MASTVILRTNQFHNIHHTEMRSGSERLLRLFRIQVHKVTHYTLTLVFCTLGV